MIFEEEKLDDTWIQDFDNVDKPYHDFYKENIYYVNINIFYVNKENEIDKITNELFFMKNHNVISREEIIDIIKRNSFHNKNIYSLLSILKYNITINPEDVSNFLNTNNNEIIEHYNNQFLTILQHIDTIVFEKTISMFQELNTLFIIFYEKDNNNNGKIANNCTKKIYFTKNNAKHNKTVRK
jgi:hypothetical protein